MPQECISDSVFCTAWESSTLSPVVGQIPPLARVAAITAPDCAVTSIEQSYKRKQVNIIITNISSQKYAHFYEYIGINFIVSTLNSLNNNYL